MNDAHSSLPPDRLWQPTTAKWFAALFGGALVYAILRYHIAGNVAWAHFPLFIFNKATSLALVVGVVALFLLMSPAITTLPMMPKALGGKRGLETLMKSKTTPSCPCRSYLPIPSLDVSDEDGVSLGLGLKCG